MPDTLVTQCPRGYEVSLSLSARAGACLLPQQQAESRPRSSISSAPCSASPRSWRERGKPHAPTRIASQKPRRTRHCSSSIRFGTSCSPPSRPASWRCCSNGSISGRAGSTSGSPWMASAACAGDDDRRRGRGRMTRATPIPDTVTLHVPFRVVKRGGRKEI